MKLEHSRALITGAAGGIGSAVAARLARAGLGLLLTDTRAVPLEQLAARLAGDGADVLTAVADITTTAGRDTLAAFAEPARVDVLINVAGVNPFGLLSQQSPQEIERALLINATAPILLCRAMLPILVHRTRAQIINVGSTFGSIGFPGFAVYSASKFALRGFTEALRRELANTSIRVRYVAPRATQTALATDRLRAMNEELGIRMDSPATVACAIERALRRGHRETYLGATERLSIFVNSLFPGIVDRALRKQLAVIERYAATPTSNKPSPDFHLAGVKQ